MKSGIKMSVFCFGDQGGAKKPKNQKVQFISKKVFFLVGGHLGDKSKCQKIRNIIIWPVSGPIGPKKGKNKHNGKGQFFRNIGLKIG